VVRLAIAVPGESGQRLAAEAVRHGHSLEYEGPGGTTLLQALHAGHESRVEVAIVSAAPGHLTRAVLDECDDRGVRLLATVATDAERRQVRELGLFEYVSADAAWTAVEEALVIGGMPAGQTAVRTPASTVLAVWGPAGAPGRTTLAIAIAAELAAAGYSVALGDVDTHSASIAPSLGMLDEAPGFAAACRLAGADSLTRSELERIGQCYSGAGSSFWVLTGIGQPSRWPELSAPRVTATIEACRNWVDFTVLDTASSLEHDEEISSDLFAPRRNAATIAALRAADSVVAVGAADPVGLSRFLRAHGDLSQLLETDVHTTVVNKLRASAVGFGPAAQVRQTLARFGGIDEAELIPYDRQAMDAALLTGTTLAEAAPRSAVRTAIRQLVHDRLLPAAPVAAGRRGRFAPATG
jgi:MinD superfamily P-loop ATPase